jgi:D-alanyl-D-alanine dipeptidase
MKKIIGFLCFLCLCSSLAFASPAVPRDVAYLLGLYYGNGSRFLIRENQGGLELVYNYDQESSDFSKSNIFPLKKEHFDSYTINEEGPVMSSEEAVRFDRNTAGMGTTCSIGGKRFSRYFYPGENNNPFRFPVAKDYPTLVQKAGEAVEPGNLKSGTQANLVNLLTSVPRAKADLRYATINNCFGVPLYNTTKAYASSEVAAALSKVAADLATQGYGLLIWDAYRPWSVSKLASDLLPVSGKKMLPGPNEGEDRNTGMTVDVSLYDLATGASLSMMSDFDEVSPRQYSKYPGGTTEQRRLRELLQSTMVRHGFKISDSEWWHFALGDTKGYSHLNIPYNQLP